MHYGLLGFVKMYNIELVKYLTNIVVAQLMQEQQNFCHSVLVKIMIYFCFRNLEIAKYTK